MNDPLAEIDLDLDNTKKNENKGFLNNSYKDEDEFRPIQKNEKLFKFILNSTKLEIKSNSLINMIYAISFFDLYLWLVCFALFVFSPESFFLCWVLTIHIAKGIFGFILLHYMPKTYEVIEKISLNPNFDENKITDVIYDELKNFFMGRWAENKKLFLTYFIIKILAIVIDFICFIVHIAKQHSSDESEYNSVMIIVTFLFLCKHFINND